MHTLLKSIRVAFPSVIVLLPMLSHAEEFRYRYIDLNVTVPGYDFFSPTAMNDSGVIAGTVLRCDETSCFDDHVAVYKNGRVTVLQPGDAVAINANGTIGGAIVLDPATFQTQAALFRGHNNRTVIPFELGQVSSFIGALNGTDVALVDAQDAAFNDTIALWRHGQTIALDFGPEVFNAEFFAGLNLNNNNIIAGTNYTSFVEDRAFRFNVNTGRAQLLAPVSPDTLSWGMDANNSGYVVGYSFVLGSPYHERIGVWNRSGHFRTYYNETINSSYLAFNDRNQIVIGALSPRTGDIYLVPLPGVRLSLFDLVENLPTGADLDSIEDFNNRGDILGFGFLLKRICSRDDEDDADAAAAAAVPAEPISAAAMESLKLRPQMRLAARRLAGAKHL